MPFYTHDNVPDSPINNFGTWNPLKKYEGSPVYSNGNLLAEDRGNDIRNTPVTCNFPRTGGCKWYTEFYFYDAFNDINSPHGVCLFEVASDKTNTSLGVYGYGKEYLAGDSSGSFKYRSTQNNMPYFDHGWGYAIGQNYGIIGIMIDYESNSIRFSANGQWGSAIFPMDSNAVISGINLSGKYNLENESLYVRVSHGSSDRFKVAMNCGQDPTFGGLKSPTTTYPDANGLGQFYYDPPTVNGEKALALCTANLPEGPIKLSKDQTPSDHFKAVTYTGDNSNDREINVNLAPDLVWIKNRDVASIGHIIADTVRGSGKLLHPNATSSEADFTASWKSSYGDVSGFTQNGFKVNTGGNTNGNGNKMIAWCWRAAGSPADNQAKIINEDGSDGTMSTADLKTSTGASITPSKVSANRQNGFSIVSYTGNTTSGATVGHGLNTAPDVIIFKNRGITSDWHAYHSARNNAAGTLMYLNTTSSGGTTSAFLNNTAPNNSVITLGNSAGTNGSSMIAYCWHSVAGYSKCGSYVGNGSPDGPYVECGFRVGWLMVKCTSTSSTVWMMFDSERDRYNVMESYLKANDSSAEASYPFIDFLSNGFKHRHSSSHTNANNASYIYMAFAEQPFSGPSNAR